MKLLLLTKFCYNCIRLGKNGSYGRSRVSLLPTTSQSQSQYDTVSHGVDSELASSQSVVPSMSYLRNNESVQHEVEKRLTELRNLNESANKGWVKSQRWSW